MNPEELERTGARHEMQDPETACTFKKPVANVKIVSGGQTGVDRGALEAAVALGLEFGGWAPHGWIAEDGTIPAQYRERCRNIHRWAAWHRTIANGQRPMCGIVTRR